MNATDWLVLFSTLVLIVAYGVWKTRMNQSGMDAYLRGGKSMPWWTICVSIMATQASAITFLSTPGQAYEDGMRFLQFYFGLPLAMIVLSVTAVPLYHKLNVYTAYEYLESRFDVRVRSLAALLFLMLRGLSVGITIYAPSLILSAVLDWPISLTTVFIAAAVAIYTVSGGSGAVSVTQKYQLAIVMLGMLLAGLVAFRSLPYQMTFGETFQMAGYMGKLNLINLSFDLSDRYNVWSGLIGGLFLFLSYFGADQSQVGRYLGGKSVAESRMGLIFNGLLKIPMQFVILYIGVLVFVFYQFWRPPLFHNTSMVEKVLETPYAAQLKAIDREYDQVFLDKKDQAEGLLKAIRSQSNEAIEQARQQVERGARAERDMRQQYRDIIAQAAPGGATDKDYVFIHFVMTRLPHGLIGLLMAVVFSAAMASTASELNALASTTVVDVYKRLLHPDGDERFYVKVSKAFTIGWAVVGILFAHVANQAENLIQFVNIIGSLFYGSILGIFLSAFYVRYIQARSVFIAALIAQLIVLCCYLFTSVAFLLYNIIGCAVVVTLGCALQFLQNRRRV